MFHDEDLGPDRAVVSPTGSVVLAVDQGTSSSKAVLLNAAGEVLATSSIPIGHATPQPGWVEQDPIEVRDSVLGCLTGVAGDRPIASVGLSSQRESALAWDAVTGEPLSALLGWQDRRTAAAAARLLADGAGAEVRARSGLPLDPMFSALKFAWILDQIDPDRRLARAGRIRLGTVDAWLVDQLTGDYRIEAGNASRTQLLNIDTLDWDEALLALFAIPGAALPPVVRSDAPSSPVRALACGAGFGGVLGDSHAALFGHGVRGPGIVKATFGTGSSVMGLTSAPVPADSGMVHTLGWLTEEPARAFEGNILSTGATLVWLAGVLGLGVAALGELAVSVPDTNGVTLVPAFAGLGAPYWDADAQAVLTGFDQGTTNAHIARAAFESIAHQITDVLERADLVSGGRIELVLADGAPTRNDWLMQLQADLSGRTVARPDNSLLSVAGAAHLAGISAGMWSAEEVVDLPRPRTDFRPASDTGLRLGRRNWASAVARARLIRGRPG